MSRRSIRVAAVDLGATSGRVIVGEVGRDRLSLQEVHRFPNAAVRVGGSLHWDVLGIYREMLVGLRRAVAAGPLDGIGIDSWAVDYGLLDATGQLLGNPYSHRDARTAGVAAKVLDRVEPAEIYAVTGIQQLPFNTIYQLVAGAGTPQQDAAATMLLLPDLLGYWLTGALGAERTNASTTALYDVRAATWATDLAARVGVPTHLLPPLRSAGEALGPVLSTVAVEAGLPEGVPVISVGSHDTASAVVAVPAEHGDFAYLSSGTWSLIGQELAAPVLTEDARRADFTNEVGVDGTIRFLKNVMGLWVLTESLRAWSATGPGELGGLLAEAAELPGLRTVVDIDDPRLLPPGDMPARLAGLAEERGEPEPRTRAETVRSVLDSLALAYRRRLSTAVSLSGRPVDVLHVVGGGSRNELLCQLTADACEVPVVAGPEEASAMGNVLVQARALGADLPDLAAMRALVRRTTALRRYEPKPRDDWAAAELRVEARRK